MDLKNFEEIPSLDLNDFIHGDEETKQNFVKKLGDAWTEIGFVAVKNHGLDENDRTHLYNAVQQFFTLPHEVKVKYEDPEIQGQRGYIGKMKEHAKGYDAPDLKEFYHIGQLNDQNDPDTQEYPQNVFPEEVPDFETYGLKAFKTLEQAGIYLLQAVALYLGLDEHYFDDKVRNGNSILRPIHYFPMTDGAELPEDSVRAAQHTDINLITLLMGASADGLQVLRRDGEWIPITALPEQIVVNVGDMLSRLTNNKLSSTVHRVVNPPKELRHLPRFSIPFFMHPKSAMDLSCLPECIDDDHPKLFSDITAGNYLQERLKEIGF
ncbi:MAG: isopenicillin N synthase family oxygenase [Bacteroidales bacterium]|nr:isopenicillin N synthase family oxygenase [Bacteroidales bacterium]